MDYDVCFPYAWNIVLETTTILVERLKKKNKPKTQLEVDTVHGKFSLNLYILQIFEQWKTVSKGEVHQAAPLMGAIDSACNVQTRVNKMEGSIVKCN